MRSLVASAMPDLSVSSQMLDHATSVRRMGVYIGLFDFVVLSEVYQRRVFTYIGEGALDVRGVLASGLALLADVESVHLIGCTVDLGGVLALPEMKDGSLTMNRWVIGRQVDGVSLPGVSDESLESAMLVKHRLVVHETQALGDCGIDVWAHALEFPRKPATFKKLRANIAEFITSKSDDKLWQDIFEMCAESSKTPVPGAELKSSASAKCGLAAPVLSKVEAVLLEPMGFAFGEAVGASAPLTSVVAPLGGDAPSPAGASLGASAIASFCPTGEGVGHCLEPSDSASAKVSVIVDQAVLAIVGDGAELAKVKAATSFREYLTSLIGSELSKLTGSYHTFRTAEDFRHAVVRTVTISWATTVRT